MTILFAGQTLSNATAGGPVAVRVTTGAVPDPWGPRAACVLLPYPGEVCNTPHSGVGVRISGDSGP